MKCISNTHLQKHGLTCTEYKRRFPNAKVTWHDGDKGVMVAWNKLPAKTVICLNCGIEREVRITSPAKFCNRGCKSQYQIGKSTWNKGLTKDIDDRLNGGRPRIRIKRECKNCGELTDNNVFCSIQCHFEQIKYIENKGRFQSGMIPHNKEKNWDDYYGLERSGRMKKDISKALKGREISLEVRSKISKTLLDGLATGRIKLPENKNHRSKAGHREDIGHFVRSTWEANICRILNFLDIEYEYERKICRFKTNCGILILDFYLPDKDIYLEPKAYLSKEKRLKLRNFVKLYPEIAEKTFIIDEETYELLKIMFREKISNWET